MNIIGIDPGATGAMAILSPGGALQVTPFRPLYSRDPDDLGRLLMRTIRQSEPCAAYMELVHAMPTDGKRSAFAFGEANKFVKTILGLTEVHTTFVPPQTWQRFLGLGRRFPSTAERKRAHHEMAVRLHPTCNNITKAAADAVLIAEYGWRQTHGGTSI